MAIYLIRHGQTSSNAARVLQYPDTPLCESGVDQAQRLSERLRDVGIRHILSSDYARALATAEALRATTGATLEIETLLRERSFGDLRGRAYADVHAEGIDPFAADYVPPNGESWVEFAARISRAWTRTETLAESTEGHLAVISHGLVCGIVAENHVSLGPGVLDTTPYWYNTCVNIIEGPPWTLTLLNCTEHLSTQSETAPA